MVEIKMWAIFNCITIVKLPDQIPNQMFKLLTISYLLYLINYFKHFIIQNIPANVSKMNHQLHQTFNFGCTFFPNLHKIKTDSFQPAMCF